MNSRLPHLTPVLLAATLALVAAGPTRAGADQEATAPPRSRLPASEQPYAVAPAAPVAPGDKLLLKTAAALRRRSSVAARLRHQILVGEQQIYGNGSYWQQGSGADLRVRLELQIAGQEASLLQICDSRFLWIDRQLPTGRRVSRLDLRQLRADPELAAEARDDLQPGEASWSTVQPDLVAHSGGLPSLLASLSENFSFLPPQAMRLAAQSSADSQSSSVPVFAVVGHWRIGRLAALLRSEDADEGERTEPRSSNDQLSMLNSLPRRLPQEVLVLVGQSDLFPYRIEYRRLETPLTGSQSATPIPYQLSASPLVVLELTDVAFDVPIAAGQFDYAPGDADWIDQTATVLERLRRERQEQVAALPRADQAPLPVR